MSCPIGKHPLVAALTALLVAGGAAATAPDVDCQCRDPHGERRDLGTVECVDIAGTAYLVRCEMSTNTPYWRRLRDAAGCTPALAT